MWKCTFRFSAEPSRCISVTAPVAPVARVSPASSDAALTVDVIGETRAARLLPAPVFDPKGVRIRS